MTDSANFFLRPARRSDTRQMAEIAGGQTTAQALADWMDDVSAHAAWHVAEDDVSRLLGFQHIGARGDPTSETAEIATFLRDGLPLAVGSRLFEATENAARLLGYRFIDALVASTNDGARIYYQAHGFRMAARSDGHLTMRFELD